MLVNQDGETVTDAHYNKGYSLLYFGFTYCPDICPNELVKIGKIVDDLNKRHKIDTSTTDGMQNTVLKPVFISVDPPRDTIGQMKHYAKDFHSSIDWLTGTTEQIATISKAFRVYFSKVRPYKTIKL